MKTACLAAAGLIAATLSVSAADVPREIDFTQVLSGPTGEVLQECTKIDDVDKNKCAKIEVQTLGSAAVAALTASLDEDRNVDPKTKFERDRIARKVWKNPHATLSVEDIATIKNRIGKAYGAMVVGAAWPLLDPTLADK